MRAPDIQHTLPPLSQPALQQVRLHITVCSLDTYLIFEVLRSRGSLTRLAQPIRMVYRQLPLPDRQSTTQESRLDTCICYQAEADWLIAASLFAQGMLFFDNFSIKDDSADLLVPDSGIALQDAPQTQQYTSQQSFGHPPLSPSSRTKSQEMQGRIRNFLAYASAQSSAASAAASAAAAAAAATDSAAARLAPPDDNSIVTGTAEPGYRSPFAAFEDGLRSTNSASLIQFLGPEASGSLKSMGGSLRSEPSLPWADPGLLEEMRQVIIASAYRYHIMCICL